MPLERERDRERERERERDIAREGGGGERERERWEYNACKAMRGMKLTFTIQTENALDQTNLQFDYLLILIMLEN